MDTAQLQALLQTSLAHKKRKRVWILAAALIIAALIALLAWWIAHDRTHYIYKTATPKRVNVTQVVSAAGTLEPLDTVEVGSQISGRIQEVFVEINDHVAEGQVLAKINPEKLLQTLNKQKASLESARAQYQLSLTTEKTAKWSYEQLKALYERSGGRSPSKLDLHTAELEYESARRSVQVNASNIKTIESDVRSSEIDIKNSIIISPIKGIVLERKIDAGQTVAASFQTPTLFKLAKSLEQMSLVVHVAESDIGKVKAGQEVRFRVDAYPDRDFSAKVDRVSYAATQDSTNNIISYETRILVDNRQNLLRPGMSANATIIIQTQENIQAIPVGALFFEPPAQESVKKNEKKPFSFNTPPRRSSANASTAAKTPSKTIYLLENDQITPLEVEIGINDGINVQIVSPTLAPNAQIITQMQQK